MTKINKILVFIIIISLIGTTSLCIYKRNPKIIDPESETVEYILPAYEKQNNSYEYYYELLNVREKVLYKELYISAVSYKTNFASKADSLNEEAIQKIFKYLINDHPELYWIQSYRVTLIGEKRYFHLTYAYSEEKIKSLNEQMETIYTPLINHAKTLETDYDKVKYIHNELIDIGEYRFYDDSVRQDYQSIVSIFTSGETVCSGFTYAFKFLMDNLGIKSISIPDDTINIDETSHIWNAVYLDNKWYYLDITWDNQMENEGKNKYRFFLLDKKDFYSTHTLQSFLPE